MSEADLQRLLTDAATLLGWHWAHFRPARTAHGWSTPVLGPLGQGWPDLVLARPRDGRLLALKLKSTKGSPSVDQLAVHAVLIAAGLDVGIVRPCYVDTLLKVLRWVAYTPAQKAEAVALATVIGADAASAQLGMGAKAIRGWTDRAGKSPSDVIETDQWRALMDVALARVTAQVASGTMRVRDIAVVAGIAARNVRDPALRPAPATDAETAVDVLEAELSVVYGEDWPTAATVLIRAAEQALADPFGYLAALVTEHGSIQAVRDWQRAERDRGWQAVVTANREKAEAAKHAIEQAETAALIQEAAQSLRDQAGDPR